MNNFIGLFFFCFLLLCWPCVRVTRYHFSLQLQTAEQAALEKKGSASATREELEAVKLRVETLGAQLKQYQNDVSTVCWSDWANGVINP